MAVYDQLLLEYGGGVINGQFQADANKNEACIAIGIGGTGIAALKQLKKEVFQRLKPDNEEDPIPKYGHIRFIAIDSDEIKPGQGKGRLLASEMFSIKNQNLAGVIAIKNDHRMDWMDIDNISALNTPEGAGGIRQVGRYLLISKADQLKQKIQQECAEAMQTIQANSMTVYIFAGLSGGTGSGCFIDTCYIVRKLMEENGWDRFGRIVGLFFLPDVVTAKSEVMRTKEAVQYNQRNGYAAMKELDYLMNLQAADDRFYQKYGGFTIDTQLPPVDMCHLISATRADGRLQPDGFSYCISVAADYVMCYLVKGVNEVEDWADTAIITRGQLAEIQCRVALLSQKHGTSRNYHVAGVSNAELPMTQFSTYMAAGFIGRFMESVGRQKISGLSTKQKVDELAGKLKITAPGVLSRVTHRTEQLMLPDVDKEVLIQLGTMPRGRVPEPWGAPGNDFLDRAKGRRTTNCNALKTGITDYNLAKILPQQTDSLILGLFKELHALCTDPENGPYFAANMLHNGGYDLTAVIDGIIETYKEQRDTQELQLEGRGQGGILDDIVSASAEFVSSTFMNRNRRYAYYKDRVEDYYITCNRIAEYDSAISVMQEFKLQVNQLYQVYFTPMLEMLDNVWESFREDQAYLETPAARESSANTWQILKLSDVKESLDDGIDALQPQALVRDFINAVMTNYQEWINLDSDRITAFISRYMTGAFEVQMNRSLQDYLYIKYPQAAGPQQLAQEVERDIITRVFNNASAMFWCNQNFYIEGSTCQTARLSVPVSTTCVCAAADDFKDNIQQVCTVRKTGYKDRIFVMRLISGIPFYAYNGASLLKDGYTADRLAGTHLYAKTGRGDCGSGDKDWRNFLPTPMPFSVNPEMTENAEEKNKLYDEAVKEGVIAQDPAAPEKWLLKEAKSIEDTHYSLDEFMTVDSTGHRILDQLRLDAEKDRVTELLEHAWDIDRAKRTLVMKNDGAEQLGQDVVERVRRDYFLAFPKQQELARAELKKRESLHTRIRELAALENEYNRFRNTIEEFCGALFYGIFSAEDRQGKTSYTRIAKITYPYKQVGMPKELELTGPEKELFPFGAQYPLYQAFLTYQGLKMDELPGAEIRDKYMAKKSAPLQKGDNVIGRTLELAWDDAAMRVLSQNVAGQTEGQDILRFYLALVEQIQIFREKFDYEDWIRIEGDGQASKVKVVYVSDGHETMYVYPDQYLDWAWRESVKKWVRLTANMWVYEKGQWVQIQLDAQGNMVL